MTCRLCKGSGALLKVVEYWPIYPTEEKPPYARESRIVCVRCDGSGTDPQRRPKA